MFIQFTPTRLVSDAGDGILEAKTKKLDVTDKPVGKTHTALSGFSETTLNRIERISKVATTQMRLDAAALKKWRAFAASVAAGEFFTFDPLGTQANPDDPQDVQLEFSSFKEQRQPGGIFVFSFTTVEVVA